MTICIDIQIYERVKGPDTISVGSGRFGSILSWCVQKLKARRTEVGTIDTPVGEVRERDFGPSCTPLDNGCLRVPFHGKQIRRFLVVVRAMHNLCGTNGDKNR